CATCYFLQNDPIKGFYCNKDKHVWGFFDRGLDWGVWEPDTVYIALPLPKVTTKLLRQYAHQDNQNEFIREYRRVNPGRSLKEAKEDFEFMKKKLLF
ncbi:MAG TPA: hypothetical protein PLM98_19235, partial [Thiolinea sp.]|nr:hypothetical protein [Thiolinea sp.]